MDLFNRRITMTMIMDHAYSVSVPRQYILFTPVSFIYPPTSVLYPKLNSFLG